MPQPMLRAIAALALLVPLAACGDEPSSSRPRSGSSTAPAEVAPCLVDEDTLAELTGTGQSIEEVDVPDELGADLNCETSVDDRDVQMKWSLSDPFIDPPPTHEEQRDDVEEAGMAAAEADLGSGLVGWVAAGFVFDHEEARVIATLQEQVLHVEVNAADDAAVSRSQIRDEALALARAIVAVKEAER